MVSATAIFYKDGVPDESLNVTAVAYFEDSPVDTQDGITYDEGYTFLSESLNENLQYRILFTSPGVDPVVAIWGVSPE